MGSVQATIDWRTATPEELDGHRCIITTVDGTIIDGYLKAIPPFTPEYQLTRFVLHDRDLCQHQHVRPIPPSHGNDTRKRIMKQTTRISTLICTILGIIALAGCEGTPIDSSADKHTEAVTQSECSTYNAQWETCTITMPDSRRVTCIAHDSNAGISCDWDHADGADKGWTE